MSRCNKGCSQSCGRLLELWDADQVVQLSLHPKIHRVVALGEACFYQINGAYQYAPPARLRRSCMAAYLVLVGESTCCCEWMTHAHCCKSS